MYHHSLNKLESIISEVCLSNQSEYSFSETTSEPDIMSAIIHYGISTCIVYTYVCEDVILYTLYTWCGDLDNVSEGALEKRKLRT